ncbi:uncharacterized protein LOC129597219 [Paramacrobiotus metropolitanus]|uniref:uncharacterized protein LOC129597219 n=1 Tax=Paramacrobiotus metropolitanus TaxID=2943436 RepID=UPI002445CB86|nr:uncharacterized protein LOC129597219 [Paramacrobiotus metropolitanus]
MGFVPLMLPSIHGRIIEATRNCFCENIKQRDSSTELLEKLKKLDPGLGEMNNGSSARLSRISDDYTALLRVINSTVGKEPEDVQLAVAWVIKNRGDQDRAEWGGGSIASVCGHLESLGSFKNDTAELHDANSQKKTESWLERAYDRPDPTEGAVYFTKKKNETQRSLCKIAGYWFQTELE